MDRYVANEKVNDDDKERNTVGNMDGNRHTARDYGTNDKAGLGWCFIAFSNTDVR
jgi:hypothetical protein